MMQASALAILLVLAASYGIAWWSARRQRAVPVNQYLFGGNTPLLGLSSSVGAIVSMAIAFTALLSAGFVFGWQILFSIFAGGAGGLWLLFRFAHSPEVKQAREKAQETQHRLGASFLAILADRRGAGFLFFYAVAIAFYLAMLATELAVLRVFLQFFIPFGDAELVVVLVAILLVCYSYVFLGGFRGVLITDYFQLLVVLAFIGLLAVHLGATPFRGSIPPMTKAAIQWTPMRLVLLHAGVFFGTFAWGLGNLDQWYRTFGTLSSPAAEKIIRTAALITFGAAIIPVLFGSAALTRGIPSSVGNEASLYLVAELWRDGGATLRFVFIAALTCAALTTLNTYLISIQQLYYEFGVHFTSLDSRLHFVELLFKWRDIRLFAFVGAAISLAASFAIAGANVYSIGVAALCGFVFCVPAVLSAVSPRLAGAEVWSLIGGVIISPAILLWLRTRIGPIHVHLYLIPCAAAAACTLAFSAGLLFRWFRRAE